MVGDSTNILRFQNGFLKDSGLQIPTGNIFTNTLKGRIGILGYNGPYLKATDHLGRDGSDPEHIEAAQSAVLAEQVGVEDSLVILDGNKDKAERFGRAIAEISGRCPPMAICI